jgi:hypothetical protein
MPAQFSPCHNLDMAQSRHSKFIAHDRPAKSLIRLPTLRTARRIQSTPDRPIMLINRQRGLKFHRRLRQRLSQKPMCAQAIPVARPAMHLRRPAIRFNRAPA